MRYPNWPIRFNEYINSMRDKQFRYGQHDCVTFTAGAVEAITGIDHMKEARGRYASKKSADITIKEVAYGNIYKALVKKFGHSIPGAQGKRGDIAYHEQGLGIVIGRYAMFIGKKGYLLIPINRLQRAFTVD